MFTMLFLRILLTFPAYISFMAVIILTALFFGFLTVLAKFYTFRKKFHNNRNIIGLKGPPNHWLLGNLHCYAEFVSTMLQNSTSSFSGENRKLVMTTLTIGISSCTERLETDSGKVNGAHLLKFKFQFVLGSSIEHNRVK